MRKMKPHDYAHRTAWIEAVKMLGIDPKRKVPCPSCRKTFLVVQDLPSEGHPHTRNLFCEACEHGVSLAVTPQHLLNSQPK